MSRGILSDPVIMLRAETHFTYWPSHQRAPHLACRREDTGKVPWVGWPPTCPRSYGRLSGDGILSYRTVPAYTESAAGVRAQPDWGGEYRIPLETLPVSPHSILGNSPKGLP